MYISSIAQPVNQPDALRLLLDRVIGGADAILINEGDGARVLLDLAADCLAEMRSRVLRAAEVLPGTLGGSAASPHVAGSSKASVPNDELLARGFQALTVLDQTCSRIVLLISDAHALQYPALRYIQFVGRSGAPLQFVFSGTRQFFDLLNAEEFAWLRTRLTAGLIVTLAAPIAETSDVPPEPPLVSKGPADWVEETAVRLPQARSSAVSASTPSRALRLGALALLGLGGVACFVLSRPNGEVDGPAVSRPAAAVIQSLRPPEPSPPSAPAPQVLEGDASPSELGASAAEPGVPAQPSPVIDSAVQDAGLGSPPILPLKPSSTAASDAAITVWSQTEADVAGSKPNEQPPEPPSSARSLGRQGVPAALPHPAAAVPGSRAHRSKEARDRPTPLPAVGNWLPPQPVIGAWEPSEGRSSRYIGSYATDANGVRMFRLEP